MLRYTTPRKEGKSKKVKGKSIRRLALKLLLARTETSPFPFLLPFIFCLDLVRQVRFELTIPCLRGRCLDPLWLLTRLWVLAPGFEPGSRSNPELTGYKPAALPIVLRQDSQIWRD
jgi:hypothetical protein